MQLSNDAKVTLVKTAVAAGQTSIQSDAVDMAGFEGVMFIISMGAITGGAATSVKAQQSATAALGGSETDLEGTSQTIADTEDNTVKIIDIYRPTKRYVNVQVLRATQDSVINSIIAIQYDAAKKPVTHDATTVSGTETFVSPAEGTA